MKRMEPCTLTGVAAIILLAISVGMIVWVGVLPPSQTHAAGELPSPDDYCESHYWSPFRVEDFFLYLFENILHDSTGRINLTVYKPGELPPSKAHVRLKGPHGADINVNPNSIRVHMDASRNGTFLITCTTWYYAVPKMKAAHVIVPNDDLRTAYESYFAVMRKKYNDARPTSQVVEPPPEWMW